MHAIAARHRLPLRALGSFRVRGAPPHGPLPAKYSMELSILERFLELFIFGRSFLF